MVTGSSVIFGAYIAYALATIPILRLYPTRTMALIAMFLGWIFLPVEVFPAETITLQNFTVNFIGTALPSNSLITKAWVVPLVILIGLVVAMPQAVRDFQPRPVDLAIAIFCLSPALPCMAGRIAIADAMAQAAYLTGVWGGGWLVGRILLSGKDRVTALTEAIVFSGILLLPIAVLEGIRPAWLYSAAYGSHPFQVEGAGRYWGFRPIGFFEHGNQYGIWIAIAALAAVHRAVNRKPRRTSDILVASVLCIAALAGQSIGAVILLALGCIWLVLSRYLRRWTVIASAMVLVICGSAYLSGRLPVAHWAYETQPGQMAVSALRTVGRLSLAYRVRRDQMALPIIFAEPLAGHGVWDWWRPMGSRPWGIPLLIAGQYGIPALVVLAVVMIAGPVQQLFRGRSNILALIVIVAAVDAWLNSFVYFPAMLASAALAVPLRKRSSERTAGQEPGQPPPDLGQSSVA